MDYSSNNSFPETLKRLVGKGFFNFPELLVALSREGVLRDFPPLQYMIQALPGSGFLHPLMMASSLAEVERLADDFSRLTGFRRECVAYLFAGFAYAAGLLTEPPSVNEQQIEYGENNAPEWDSRRSGEEKCRFISEMISVNRDNERRLAVKVSAAACVEVGESNFRLTAELSRMEADATGALFCCVYARDGHIADIGKLGVICYNDVSPLPVSITIPVAPREVARILLYWLDE